MGCGGQTAAPAAEAPAAEAHAEEAEAPKVSSMRFPRILIPSLCGTIRPSSMRWVLQVSHGCPRYLYGGLCLQGLYVAHDRVSRQQGNYTCIGSCQDERPVSAEVSGTYDGSSDILCSDDNNLYYIPEAVYRRDRKIRRQAVKQRIREMILKDRLRIEEPSRH